MLCNKCGSLDHWEKNCEAVVLDPSYFIHTPKPTRLLVSDDCMECFKKDLEISRLKAKYEMSAEDQLDRIRTQNREAQKRYRDKRKAS